MKFHPRLSGGPRTERGLFRWALFLVGAALSCVSTVAQSVSTGTGVVAGRVLNPVTRDYLLNARVSVKGTDLVALTDETGTYRLSGIPAGSATLRVVHPGLDEQERVVDVKAGQSVQQNFDLTSRSRYGTEESPVNLQQFTVAASKEMEADILATNEQRGSRERSNLCLTFFANFSALRHRERFVLVWR